MDYINSRHPEVKRAERTTDVQNMSRICFRCKNEQPLSDFGTKKDDKFGRSHECRACKRIKNHLNKNKPRTRFCTYRKSAAVRGIPFLLSFDEFKQFWNLPCFYCGNLIDGIGLDRRESSLGYILENIDSCCSRCNYAKQSQTQEQFIQMCQMVSSRFNNHTISPKVESQPEQGL